MTMFNKKESELASPTRDLQQSREKKTKIASLFGTIERGRHHFTASYAAKPSRFPPSRRWLAKAISHTLGRTSGRSRVANRCRSGTIDIDMVMHSTTGGVQLHEAEQL